MKKWHIPLVILALAVLGYVGAVIWYNLSMPTPQTAQAVVVKKAPKELPLTRANLLKLVNVERKKAGVAPLKEDKRLDGSAQRKADDEVKYNYFDHLSPHDHQQGYTYIFEATGQLCRYASENLSEGNHGAPTSTQVVQGWVHSKPHYEAMISAKYTLTGFGIKDNQVVEHFCQESPTQSQNSTSTSNVTSYSAPSTSSYQNQAYTSTPPPTTQSQPSNEQSAQSQEERQQDAEEAKYLADQKKAQEYQSCMREIGGLGGGDYGICDLIK